MTKTIALLQRSGFTEELIVCVPHDERSEYEAILHASFPVRLITADKGLTKQRRHIRSLVPEGERIVFIDDDVTALRILKDGKLSHCTDITTLVNQCFDRAEAEGAVMFGVYPMCNRMWQKQRISIGTYIVGAFYGIKNCPLVIEPDESEFEDYARQLETQSKGGVCLRFDNIGLTTVYFNPNGGLSQTRTAENRAILADRLCGQYPGLVRRSQRGAVADLKLLVKPRYLPLAMPDGV
jgi:hypothetical protein